MCLADEEIVNHLLIHLVLRQEFRQQFFTSSGCRGSCQKQFLSSFNNGGLQVSLCARRLCRTIFVRSHLEDMA